MAKERSRAVEQASSIGLRNFGLSALIFAVTLIAYLPALQGGFLLDDDLHVTRPELQSWHGLARIWFEVGATQQYYPVLHTAFWAEHLLWGDAVLGYHLVSVALHAAAACLLVAIVRRLFNGECNPSTPLMAFDSERAAAGHERRRYAEVEWLAGFIFALHPVCVESVAWIAEQKNTLSTVFYLGSALAYLRFDEERQKSRYLPALGLFVLALLSKTSTATLPAALLVIIWWRRSRLEWRRDVRPLLPWFALAAAAGLVTALVERKLMGEIGAAFALTLLQRCLLAGRVIWFYLGKLVWPVNLTFFYPRWAVSPAAWWQYLFPLAAVALAGGLWFAARSARVPLARVGAAGLAGFLVFAGTLLPVLGFFNVEWFVFSYVADHLQYLASLGIIVPLASGLTLMAEQIPSAARRLAPVLGGALLITLGALTWRQSSLYRDAVTFYGQAVARNPAAGMAHNHLGAALAKIPGRMPDAMAEFEAALRLNPNAAEVHENLAIALLTVPGRASEAVSHLETALRIKPNLKSAHYELGLALAGLPGRLPDAIAQYEAALRIEPDDPLAHYGLGNALLKIPGRGSEAVSHFEAALRLKPDFAEAHNNLGTALLNVPGRQPEAVGHFEAALRYKPEFAQAHNNLGIALANVPGRLPEAIAHFEAALRLEPDFAAARSNLRNARQLMDQVPVHQQ
jgi:tetratricopeptide (TPR) repeat protein